jgi:hypothetical protein
MGTDGCQTSQRSFLSDDQEMKKYGFVNQPEKEEPHFDILGLLGNLLLEGVTSFCITC